MLAAMNQSPGRVVVDEEKSKRGTDLCARREKARPMPGSRSRQQANTARGMR